MTTRFCSGFSHRTQPSIRPNAVRDGWMDGKRLRRLERCLFIGIDRPIGHANHLILGDEAVHALQKPTYLPSTLMGGIRAS